MNSEIWLYPGVARLSVEFDFEWQGVPIPRGLCRHAWYVGTDQGALIDPFDEPELSWDDLVEALAEAELTPAQVRFAIWSQNLPSASLVNQFWAQGIQSVLHQDRQGQLQNAVPADAVRWVNYDSQLDLGGGMSLSFFDLGLGDGSLGVRETATATVFTGPVFSSFGVPESSFWEDLAKPDEKKFFSEGSLQWWAAFGPYQSITNPQSGLFSALKSAKALAPRCGLVWRQGPDQALNLAEGWHDWTSQGTKTEVCIVGGSGLSDPSFGRLIDGLQAGGLDVNLMDVLLDPSYMVVSTVLRSAGLVVFGSTTGKAELANVLTRLTQHGVISRTVLWLGAAPPEDLLKNLGEIESLTDQLLPEQAFETGLAFGYRIRPH